MQPMAQTASVAPTAPVPPQNLDAEESVLGAMMLSPGAIGAVSEALSAGDFYRESHAKMYKAALTLYGRGEPVDAITLVDELERRGELADVGGKVRIHELAALVPAASNAGHYARIGLDREGEEATELVDRAEQIVFELSQSRVAGDFSHIEELLKESFERITALYESGADITGVPSGFRDVDKLTSGFQPGNLIILAARPSMGKSGLALCTAANLACERSKTICSARSTSSVASSPSRSMPSRAISLPARMSPRKVAISRTIRA